MLVYIIKCMVKKDFQNYFPTKSYSSVSQNIKMRNGLIAQKAKVPLYQGLKLCFYGVHTLQ